MMTDKKLSAGELERWPRVQAYGTVLIEELRAHSAARTGYTTDLLSRAADAIEWLWLSRTDKWADYKGKHCGCHDASRFNSCQGRDNCELPAGHPDRKKARAALSQQPECGKEQSPDAGALVEALERISRDITNREARCIDGSQDQQLFASLAQHADALIAAYRAQGKGAEG